MVSGTRLLPALAIFCATAFGQQVGDPSPAFDVASVKLTQYRRPLEGPSYSYVKIVSPGRLVASNASLYECIEWAYQIKEYQFSGPEWLKSGGQNYDIEGVAPPETSPVQMRLMLQKLLTERFDMKVHHESRTLPVYDLLVAKNGPKLEPANTDGQAGFSSAGGRMVSQRATMAGFASWLSREVDHPVINKTDLTGFFAIKLEWIREGDSPSIFAALQEQLGLKLQAARAPVDILIVDRAQRIPTAN